MTLLGEAVYERAYYYCPHCRSGFCPSDEEFRIEGQKTPAANEVTALAGVLHPFDEAATEVLPKMCGINLSASTVQKVTERVGEAVAQRRAAGEVFGLARPWKWHRDASGKTVAYIGLDATGVRQQGVHAEQSEGRMAWVGVIFNPHLLCRKRRVRMWDSRYVAGLMSLAEIGQQLRREAQAVGIAQADRVVALTDGGAGLENCLLNALGGVAHEIVFILDFWHASEHLQEFVNVFLPDERLREEQMKIWCHQLKHSGGSAVLQTLMALDLARASPQVLEAHRQLTGYLRNNLHRTDYPTYVKNGWQIGSGKVESACKSVICQRLKCSGMRWRAYGTTALCQLRALYKSRLWTQYWQPAP